MACSDRVSRLKPPGIFFCFNVFTMHCRTLLGLKHGVEGLFTSLFSVSNVYSVVIVVTSNVYSVVIVVTSSFHLPVQRISFLVLLSVFIFPFHAFLHVYQFGQVTCVFPRLCLAVDFSLLLG